MRFKIAILILVFTVSSQLQAKPKNIEVNKEEAGTSEKMTLDAFNLNHVLYIKAFVLSDIYSSVTAEEMAFINSTLLTNLEDGCRTQFIIQTDQKVAYRLAVSIVKNKSETMLLILTNFNPDKGQFEKKIKDNHYATTAEIKDGVVLGSMFEVPLGDEQPYLDKKDYVSVINMNLFSRALDTEKLDGLFKLADENQKVMVNNINWLKSYYYLAQNDFTKSYNFLNALEKSVRRSDEGEQKQWAMFIKVLRAEIESMQAMQ